MIAKKASAYLMHGDTPEIIGDQIKKMKAKRAKLGLAPLSYGMASYMICRPTDAEALEELEKISKPEPDSPAWESYHDFVSQSKLISHLSIEDYIVSNRGLRSKLVGSPETILQRLKSYEEAGVELLLVQASPMLEELDTIGQEIIIAYKN